MKEEFTSYFKAIEAPQKLMERADLLLQEVQNLYGFEVDDVIICSYMKEQQEEYTSLWFIASDKLIECKDFLTTIDIDLAKYANGIKYFNMVSNDFSVSNAATSTSSVSVSLVLDRELTSEFKACRKNCDFLVAFAKKYFIPNLV